MHGSDCCTQEMGSAEKDQRHRQKCQTEGNEGGVQEPGTHFRAYSPQRAGDHRPPTRTLLCKVVCMRARVGACACACACARTREGVSFNIPFLYHLRPVLKCKMDLFAAAADHAALLGLRQQPDPCCRCITRNHMPLCSLTHCSETVHEHTASARPVAGRRQAR